MKIILNKCFGGFDVSPRGYELYARKKGLDLYVYKSNFNNGDFEYERIDCLTPKELFVKYFTKDFGKLAKISDEDYSKYNLTLREEHRTDETLIEVVEELKDVANGRFGDLEIIEIPDNCFYKIDEYDGVETLYYSNSEINIK